MKSLPEDPFVVLGVDPGLSVTGYGVVSSLDGCFQGLAFGVIKTTRSLSGAERLKVIHQGLVAVVKEWKPQTVAIEDFVVGYTRAAVAIGEARAMALLAAAQAALDVTLYKPSEVKLAVTSYGRGSKEQVAEMVRAFLGLKEIPQPADVTDALAVALCHCFHNQSGVNVAK